MRHDRRFAGPERRLCSEVFRSIGLSSTGSVGVVKRRCLENHEIGCFQFGPGFCERVLDRLVLPNRPPKNHSLTSVGGRLLQSDAANTDGFGGN